jgi:ribonuclease HI
MGILYTYSDGGARGNPGPAAIGVVLCDEHGTVVQEASNTIGERTNNQAEYEAMLLALELARARNARRLRCFADSELLIYQIQGSYKIKNEALKRLAEKVKSLTAGFESVTFQQVPRSHPMIARADKLLNQTLDRARKTDRPARPVDPDSPRQKELF